MKTQRVFCRQGRAISGRVDDLLKAALKKNRYRWLRALMNIFFNNLDQPRINV